MPKLEGMKGNVPSLRSQDDALSVARAQQVNECVDDILSMINRLAIEHVKSNR